MNSAASGMSHSTRESSRPRASLPERSLAPIVTRNARLPTALLDLHARPPRALLRRRNCSAGPACNGASPVAAGRGLGNDNGSVVASALLLKTGNRGGFASASSITPRVRIAVDVDEVLGRFVYTLNQFCKEKYGMEYGVHDYWIYEFAKIWKCSQEQSNHIVHEFFQSQHFNDGIPVIPGALEALQRLGVSHDLAVVTSRQHVIQDTTLEWIDRHYRGLFQEVYFGNHFALEGTSRKKSDICKAIGASVLIDDNPVYAQECAAAGIHVLLYDWEDTYPWSKLPPGSHSELITVVRNWDDVEAALLRLAPVLVRQ